MSHHACFALQMEFLDIVLIEDSKPMQLILRSMLTALRARRVRVFDTPAQALDAMLQEPPNLIVSDWRMPGMSGEDLLKTIRSPQMSPLCFVPVMVVTAHATQGIVESVMRHGGHLLLVKPVSPTALFDRIQWILSDDRRFVIDVNGNYVIEGVAEKLESQKSRAAALRRARVHHEKVNGPAEAVAKTRPVPRVVTTAADTPSIERRSSAPTRRQEPAVPMSAGRRFAAVVK